LKDEEEHDYLQLLLTTQEKKINNNRQAMRNIAAILGLLIGMYLHPSGLLIY